MIHARELRLGNWYKHKTNSNFYKLGTADFMDYLNEAQVNDGMVSIDPIPLTPLLMNATGLVENTPLWCANEEVRKQSAKDEGIRHCSFLFNNRLSRWMETQTRVCVDHVHQLQNIYFSLTQQELTVELN